MRTKFLTLVALLVAGAVRADVVLEMVLVNVNPVSTHGSRTISITSNGSGQTLTFLQLFGVGNDTANFQINGGTVASIESDGTGLFDLSTLTGSLTINGTNTLSIALLLGGYQQSNYDGSISTTFGDSTLRDATRGSAVPSTSNHQISSG